MSEVIRVTGNQLPPFLMGRPRSLYMQAMNRRATVTVLPAQPEHDGPTSELAA